MGACRSTAAAPPVLLTGDAFAERLAQPENIVWQEAPLRDAIAKFCRAQQLAFLLDRRIDPGQRIDGQMQAMPVAEIFERLAENRNLGISFFESVIYFGPHKDADILRTLAELRHEEMRRLPAAAAAKLAQTRSFAWDDFATPRQLLEKLAEEGGVEIAGLERIPHDLWAGAELPPLALIDRVTLIAIQFDLTFGISPDGSRLTLVPIPEDVSIVRSYPGGRSAEELMASWQALAPESQFKLSGGKIWVKGRLEGIEKIEARRRPSTAKQTSAAPSTAKSPAERRFSGRVVNKRLSDVLQYVEAQFGLQVTVDRQSLEKAGVSLDQLVSFNVKDADVDELLKALLEPVHCTFTRQGTKVEVKPAP